MALESGYRDSITTRETLTVSLLNRAVAGLLSRGFPLVRVRGEVSGLTRAASGHWYFALKDDDAQVRCVMYRTRNALVRRAPRDGDAVEVVAQVTLYEPRGEYQLNIESLLPTGQGRLYEEFVRLRERLGAEGLFDDARKRALPAMPSIIGIVTSLQAAALRDVLTTLRRRAPYCRTVIYPVPVQGEGAARAIASMLARASARAEVDVLLLVRGGGSIEDLWSFNDEAVARAIRASAIPVIVGIGHESDYTIADFAADLRAPTPTAAAEVVAPDASDLGRAVAARAERLRGVVQSRLGAWSQKLDYATRALPTPRAPLAGLRARIAQLVLRASRVASSRASTGRIQLAARSERLRKGRPDIASERQALRERMSAIAGSNHTVAQRSTAKLERLCAELAHLDPNAVLTRGYSIVREADGRLVTNAGQLSIGQAIDVVLAAGGASARVEHVTPQAQKKDP
ncbi:MAG TPA: exodeoxyribonuclease VII large subunit [Burkholderiaceae bacterium]|nr:exodeoxyribonuclease VII large subunit [Burkholderiaceae bacterium]